MVLELTDSVELKMISKKWKFGCSTNPVGENSPTGFFTCKKEKSEL